MVVNDSVFPNVSSYLSNNATLCHSLYLFLDMKLRESLPSFYIVTAIAVCVLNVLTACSALALNAIAVLTILLIPELRQQPKNFLLCSLAVSDFFVGLLCQPSFIMAEILLILGRMDLYCYTVFFHFYTSWVFLSLALQFHLRYTQFITTSRVIISVLSYWSIWIIWLTVVWFGVQKRVLIDSLIALCFLIAAIDGCCYFFIVKIVKRHNSQIQQTTSRCAKDIARHRRTANTMFLLVSAFVLSYLPFAITSGISALQKSENLRTSAAHCVAVTFVSANSCINPLIYFWRVGEFREDAKRTLRKLNLINLMGRVSSRFQTRVRSPAS